MSKLVRFINKGIHDFFIAGREDSGDGCHQFKNSLPDSFADGQFVAVLIHLSEEFVNSLVVHESFHGRENVIPEHHEGSQRKVCYEPLHGPRLLRCMKKSLASVDIPNIV